MSYTNQYNTITIHSRWGGQRRQSQVQRRGLTFDLLQDHVAAKFGRDIQHVRSAQLRYVMPDGDFEDINDDESLTPAVTQQPDTIQLVITQKRRDVEKEEMPAPPTSVTLPNPQRYTIVHSVNCNACSQLIVGTRNTCTVCPSLTMCPACYRSRGHTHPMRSFGGPIFSNTWANRKGYSVSQTRRKEFKHQRQHIDEMQYEMDEDEEVQRPVITFQMRQTMREYAPPTYPHEVSLFDLMFTPAVRRGAR
ncbi:hypothetical protein PROFUN_04606 [Planoprotostelium fungivorum]|uniref:ZZ-type domain-containing protein n=1 Tax=Planoprotostelium fungivorum TaxID=1890364 RepID=A0A2P6NUD8_9EUKA|nr:hypothetical protein PROFUN_04606 [Planoprotostelium fungivorum]